MSRGRDVTNEQALRQRELLLQRPCVAAPSSQLPAIPPHSVGGRLAQAVLAGLPSARARRVWPSQPGSRRWTGPGACTRLCVRAGAHSPILLLAGRTGRAAARSSAAQKRNRESVWRHVSVTGEGPTRGPRAFAGPSQIQGGTRYRPGFPAGRDVLTNNNKLRDMLRCCWHVCQATCMFRSRVATLSGQVT